MQTKLFEGKSSEMKENSIWLASEDILDLDEIEVEIECCYFHKDVQFDGGRKENKYALKFVKANKQLVLNSCNRKTLVSKFGNKVKEWKGKKIKLYVKRIKAFGKTMPAIRIKD